MMVRRFKPCFDKMFYIIWIPTTILMALATVISASSTVGFIILLATDVFTLYFLLTSIVGYVELREKTVYIKCGFIISREIPYEKIRGISKEHKVYADSMVSIKNSLDHVNIKYNRFDIISVSVVNNDGFIMELEERIKSA